MDPEPSFFFAGDREGYRPERPTVGIIGTREPTEYGERLVEDLLRALAGRNWNVVSGGARGVDGLVHAAALRRGIPTQAVLVGPIEDPGPRQNSELFERIRSSSGSGLLVPGELEPSCTGRDPMRKDWLRRNEYLVGLCDALVVIEAAMPSGTWASVKAACQYSVPVFLFPGTVYSALSNGTNQMILMGYGHMVLSVEDLVAQLIVHLLPNSYNEY